MGARFLDISKLDEEQFINVYKVLDICKARILSMHERKMYPSGSPDVVIQEDSGETRKISRKEFIQQYRLYNNNKIKMRNIRANKQYIVIRSVKEKCKAIRIPKGSYTKIDGKNIREGNYVIISEGYDEGNNTRTVNMYPLSGRIARKVLIVPMQKRIQINIARKRGAKGNKKLTRELERQRQSKAQINKATRPVNSMSNNTRQHNRPKRVEEEVKKPNNPIIKSNDEYRFTATHRLISMENNRLVGFTLYDKQDKTVRQLNMNQVYSLCKLKQIENLVLVERDGTNKKFIRGNGIHVDALPKVIV